MSAIMCKDKKVEAKIVATNYVLDNFNELERGEIDLQTFAEKSNVKKVEGYIKKERPYIVEQIGEEALKTIVVHVVTKYVLESIKEEAEYK